MNSYWLKKCCTLKLNLLPPDSRLLHKLKNVSIFNPYILLLYKKFRMFAGQTTVIKVRNRAPILWQGLWSPVHVYGQNCHSLGKTNSQ